MFAFREPSFQRAFRGRRVGELRWLRQCCRAAVTGTATGTAMIITGPAVTGTPAWVEQPKVQHRTSESAS